MPYPSHSQRTILKVWTFGSTSGNGTYETLQYNDLSTSCNCAGWTRRVAVDGSRSCRHTRLVHQGLADQLAMRFHDYTAGQNQQQPQPKERTDTNGKDKDGSRAVGKLGRRRIV